MSEHGSGAARESNTAADRARRTAIMALSEAKGREPQAEHICANTNLTVDEARAMLAVGNAARGGLVAEMRHRSGLDG